MPSDIQFSDPPQSFDGANAALLPWNYAQVAMPDMIGRGNSQARILMALPTASRPARYAAIGPDTLADPVSTLAYIAGLDGIGADPSDPDNLPRYFLGPETEMKPFDPAMNLPPEVIDVSAEAWNLVSNRPFTQAVVIIDAGIGFWNARFRGQSGPRFRGMRYFDFSWTNGGTPNTLDEAQIDNLCTLADREGNAAVMRHLGSRFPASVFGASANPDPDALWHGTAVADLAAGAPAGAADDVALFGLELPRAVIADYSGGILTATLALILDAVIAMTAAFADKPLTIVMPLGFPAGPQDGTHPAAAEIDRALARSGRTNIRLVLPAGNHLQDRCHARLNAPGSAGAVHWDLPPEDFSTNSIEILAAAGQPAGLSLAAPGQAVPAPLLLGPASFRFVEWQGDRIGIVLRGPDTPLHALTVLSLWHTAGIPGRIAAPFGRWTLSATSPLHLWLARDDRDPVADRGRPRRPSQFWDAALSRTDASGAMQRDNDPGSAILRTGTLSVLATARSSAVLAVQAMERPGAGPARPSGYSSRREDGLPTAAQALVDDGYPGRGVPAAANGGQRRVRITGTSAAAGLHARSLVLPNLPPDA